MFNRTHDLNTINDLSATLLEGLSSLRTEILPEEIVSALETARTEMEYIPVTLQQCRQAKDEFAEVEFAIDRLLVISREASNLPDNDQKGRGEYQAEFVELARNLARLAGRRNYTMPELSLKDKAHTLAAGMALKSLKPVKLAMAENLKDQETNIIAAVEATFDFLKAVTLGYPTAVSKLPEVLREKVFSEESANFVTTRSGVQNKLH